MKAEKEAGERRERKRNIKEKGIKKEKKKGKIFSREGQAVRIRRFRKGDMSRESVYYFFLSFFFSFFIFVFYLFFFFFFFF
jgi:hypothetical protein